MRKPRIGATGPLLLLLLLLAPGLVSASIESELAFHNGVAAYGQGRLDEAREHFERVLREDPGDSASLHYLGLIAQAQGDHGAAIEAYQRALEGKPDDLDLRFDLGAALLGAGRNQEARESFEAIVAAQPDRARAQLFAGVAEYRLGNHSAARERLRRAVQLDPQVGLEARFYLGLANAFLGDYSAAAGDLAVVEDQSPLSPLGRSAGELRREVQAQAPPPRWSLAVTTGMEWDSNPLVLGEGRKESQDFRGVLRVRGGYQLVRDERFDLRVGYDGFASLHKDESQVDVQTHVAWSSASARVDRFLLGLRYDFAHTRLDLTRNFRRLHRVTPSVSTHEGRWGITQLFYQYQDIDFFNPNLVASLDRDGQQHSAGLNQFFLLSEPFLYVRVGGLWDRYDPDGQEFEYDGYEVSAAFAVQLPWRVTLTADYRLIHRSYRNDSFFEAGTERHDRIHRWSVDLTRPLGRGFELALSGSRRDNDSNVATFDYDRTVVGTYVTYQF